MDKKGEKSCYVFECVADVREIYRILNDFLYANNFKFVEKNGLKYFMNSDPIAGKRFLEYYFNGNVLYLYAYIHNTKKPWPLDDKYLGSVPKQAYRNMLEPLITEITRVNENARYNAQYQGYNQNVQYSNTRYDDMQYNQMNSTPYYQPQGTMQSGYAGTYQNKFADVNNKSKENQAMWGFYFSVAGMLMSLFGWMWGFFILFIEIYFAIQGLSTRKRIFSILTFVFAAVSLVILILYITGINLLLAL